MRIFLYIGFALLPLLLFGQSSRELKGDKLYEKGQFIKAINVYKQAWDETPDKILARKVAQCWHARNDLMEASRWYFKQLTFTDNQPSDYFDVIMCRILNKSFIKATELIDQMNQFFPGNRETEVYRAIVDLYEYELCTPDRAIDKKVDYCVELDGTENSNKGDSKVDYKWEFEDGAISTELKVRKCFKKSGEHIVEFSAITHSLHHKTKFDTTLIISFLEDPNFIITGSNNINQSIHLYAYNQTRHPNFHQMIWDTGDGHLYLGESVNHIFRKTGKQTITLYVLGKHENGDIYPIGCLKKPWNIIEGS